MKPVAHDDSADEALPSPTLRSVHEVPSLGAYLGDLWRRRDFIWFSSVQKLRSENVRAALGSFWFLLTPLFNIVVYWLIFGKLLKLDRGEGNYVTFLAIGILMFDLLARSLPTSALLIERNLTLIRSVYFPRAVLPIAFAVEQLIRFLPSIIVMIVFVLAGGDAVQVKWLLLLPAIAIAFVFLVGLTLIFTRIGKVGGDVALILPHITRMLFYGSGVLYLPEAFTSNELILRVFDANPFYEIISLVRSAMTEAAPIRPGMWMAATVWAVGTAAIGFVFFWRGEKNYGE